MALPSITISDWQFHCTLCQEVFTDPVSTPCGHNFCKACLTALWEGSDLCQCPLCQERFEGPLDIRVNTIFAQMTHYLKTQGLKAPKLVNEHEENSCLSRHTSVCGNKAQSCSIHEVLLDPSLDLQDSKCEDHDEPLELFRSTDRRCVCRLCVEDEHGEHSIVPVEREWLYRHNELRTKVLQVKQGILDRRKKMEDIKRRTRLSREDADKELKEGLQILNALLRSVEECQAELPKVIEGKQKAVESRAQNLLEELEQEIRDLKTRKDELKQLMCCQDHVNILQSLPSQLTPPSSKDWDNVIVHTDLRAGTLRSVLTPLEENFSRKLKELTDAEFQKVQRYADDVTLDPLTAHRNLELSADGKEVSYQRKMQPVSDNPKRFSSDRYVLGKQMFRSGRHYWEVEVEGLQSWRLGVAKASISRKRFITPQPQNGVWLLQQKQVRDFRARRMILEALSDPPVILNLSSGLKKVGVYVDYEECEISFYNVEAKSLLFSFTGNTFTEELCLLLNLEEGKMILSPVSQTE